MAIAHKAASSLTSHTSGTSIAGTLPSYAAGDLAIFVACVSKGSRTFSTPSGWTAAPEGTRSNALLSVCIFYKVLGSSESNPSTSVTGGNLSSSSAGYGRVHLFTGCSSTSPIVEGNSINITTSVSPTSDDVYPDSPEQMVASFLLVDNDDDNIPAWSAPSGWSWLGSDQAYTPNSADVHFHAMGRFVDPLWWSPKVPFGTLAGGSNSWASFTFVLNPTGHTPGPRPYSWEVDQRNNNSASWRSPSVTFQEDVEEGDVVVMFAASTAVSAMTTPSGWSNPLGGNTNVQSDAHTLACVARRVTSGEAAANTLTYTATNLWNSNTPGEVTAFLVRGVDPDALFAGVGSAFNSSNLTSHTLAAVTPTETGGLVVAAIALDGTGWWNEVAGWDTLYGTSTRQALAGTLRHAPSVASSTISATTITLNAGGGDEYASITVVIPPAEQGEPPPPPIEAVLATELYPDETGDRADGAAIIPDGADTVVITTSKAPTTGGLYVLDLAGEIIGQDLYGASNSVDWRDLTGIAGWDNRLLILTVDRDNDTLRYYWLNRATKALTLAGTTSLGYEPYGSCLAVHDGSVYAFVSDRGADNTGDHYVRQYLLSRSGESVSAGSAVRTITEDWVMEGMAADDQADYLYVSNESRGLWRFGTAPGASTTPTVIDTPSANLVPDIEDVAIARTTDGVKLLVSSQGDSSYHVYDAVTFDHELRFTVVRPGGSSPVVNTDGLDVHIGRLGSSFPHGLIVLHDAGMTPVSNFVYVDAAEIFGELPSWDGSYVRIANGDRVRVRMANGDKASIRLSDGIRL